MARMDISVNEDELKAILEEFRTDYNRHHFVRDEEFDQSWDRIDGETRQLFVEFLERHIRTYLLFRIPHKFLKLFFYT
uniref:Uncharacterized protein n=1 Tax=Tolypothrix bouteillei VB521301 TaxID=1479485 RepID=A0A0C1QWD4_9CYAN